ncbi:exported protein of unknown function [Streptomyces sp. KY75]|nr:exported protein of unknown function [Streptomyces sp. KY75]
MFCRVKRSFMFPPSVRAREIVAPPAVPWCDHGPESGGRRAGMPVMPIPEPNPFGDAKHSVPHHTISVITPADRTS